MALPPQRVMLFSMKVRAASCCLILCSTSLLTAPASVALAADPAAARAEVQSTLATMSRAALAADASAFLAHVAQGEPFFATEWRHWADQLKPYPPVEFSLTIGDGDAVFDGDRAEFPLVMSWLITCGPKESWGAGGTRRTVTFPTVVFAREDPDGSGPLASTWVFRGEKWTELKGDNFVVRYIPDDDGKAERVARDILQAFPVARAHDNEGFGVEPPPQILKLYTSMDHLKATVYMNMPDHYLGGWSEPDESVKFMTTYTSGVKGWTNAYAHEYGHVCTWTMGPAASTLPWWVTEGAAELAAQEFRPGYWKTLDSQMRRRLANSTLAGWDDIADYIKTQPKLKGLAYTQGHHMLGFITIRHGREGRNAWLRAQCNGATLDEATLSVLKVSFEELDRQWRAALAEPAAAPQDVNNGKPGGP